MLEIGTKFNAEDKLWEGPEIKPFFNPKVSIGQVIIRMLAMHGPKIAQASNICMETVENISMAVNSRDSYI